mmetsp:Transcript_22429/g.45768  ORF Transcript_22429/g.45768 Transcript_22429/m.45768 type:complete len:156 (+) Transcript_22429:633-1100(+)
MLAEADSDPPPLLVAMAAAPAMESCSMKDRTKTEDEATISGCVASQLGILQIGVTTVFCCSGDGLEAPEASVASIGLVLLDVSSLFWLLPSIPSTDGIFPAKINNNDRAQIHSAVVVAIAAPVGPMRSHQIKTTSNDTLTRFEKTKTAKVVLVSR